MTVYHWLWFGLIYLLAGQIFSLVYLLNFRDEQRRMQAQGKVVKDSSAWLGLMGLFFPLYLVVDLIVTLAGGLGAHVPALLARIERKDKS